VLSPGQRFEGYVVEALVGRGGSSVVYRAHDTGPEARTVALKVLTADSPRDDELARLEREFTLLRRLDHRHIVGAFAHGPGWLASEYAAGGAITDLATIPNRLVALAQIADALDYLHGQGIVHCDVKPANILVRQDFYRDGAVLVDFGSAHARDQTPRPHSALVTASLPYAAPELLLGQPVSDATDEYALACTLVELITGAPPFRAATAAGLTAAQLRSAAPRPSRRIAWLPTAFDSVLAKAMAKRPSDRYRSCGELMGLITRILRD
jgi:serine/threonine protein kinase